MIHFASKHVLLQQVASSSRGSACVVGQYVTQLERRFHQPIQRLQLLGVAMQAACPKSIRQCFVPRYHESAKHQYTNTITCLHTHTDTLLTVSIAVACMSVRHCEIHAKVCALCWLFISSDTYNFFVYIFITLCFWAL